MRAPARVREPARLVQLVERELRAIVARIEALGAEIDRVGAIGDGGPRGVERAGGRKELGNRARRHEYGKVTASLPRFPRRIRRPTGLSAHLRRRRGAGA